MRAHMHIYACIHSDMHICADRFTLCVDLSVLDFPHRLFARRTGYIDDDQRYYNPRHASTVYVRVRVNVFDFLDQLAFDNPNSLNVFK
jgi:hypothetical protein